VAVAVEVAVGVGVGLPLQLPDLIVTTAAAQSTAASAPVMFAESV
jgi:hypothetical protein